MKQRVENEIGVGFVQRTSLNLVECKNDVDKRNDLEKKK